MSDKRNDFIEGNDFAFSKVYEMMPDFWKTQHQWIEDYAAREKNAKD